MLPIQTSTEKLLADIPKRHLTDIASYETAIAELKAAISKMTAVQKQFAIGGVTHKNQSPSDTARDSYAKTIVELIKLSAKCREMKESCEQAIAMLKAFPIADRKTLLADYEKKYGRVVLSPDLKEKFFQDFNTAFNKIENNVPSGVQETAKKNTYKVLQLRYEELAKIEKRWEAYHSRVKKDLTEAEVNDPAYQLSQRKLAVVDNTLAILRDKTLSAEKTFLELKKEMLKPETNILKVHSNRLGKRLINTILRALSLRYVSDLKFGSFTLFSTEGEAARQQTLKNSQVQVIEKFANGNKSRRG